MDLVVAASLV